MPKTKKQTKNNSQTKQNLKISKDKLKHFIDSCLDNMKTKQDIMLKTYNFGKKNNQFIFYPNHKKFYMFNKDKGEAFLEAQFLLELFHLNQRHGDLVGQIGMFPMN